MMRSLRKHAPTWFARRGSQECLLDKPSEPQCCIKGSDVKTEFEITSYKIKHFLERGEFKVVVEMIRDLQQEFIWQCLKSFPFKTLNKHVPKSFPVWEILLMKLHNNSNGEDPVPTRFPYAACNELVLRVGQLLETVEDMPHDNADLIHACKLVLKKVCMQYTGVLHPLVKESKRIEHAVYSLSLHLPIGTDPSAVTLHTAIRDEVEACVADYQDSLEKIADIEERESLSLSRMLTEIQQNDATRPNDAEPVIEFQTPDLNQIQLQERLYSNQYVMRALEPNQREGNLAQLVEMLKTRIVGDKEVIALFGRIRSRNALLSDKDTVEPWLRKHQRAVECAISMLKDIEKELQLNIRRCPSSPNEGGSELSSSLEDNGSNDLLSVPVLRYPTDEDIVNRPPSMRRASAAAHTLFNIGEKEGEDDEADMMTRRYSVPPHSGDKRPRSASPMKFIRTNGIVRHPATNRTHNGGAVESGSCKSLSSSRGSSHSLIGRESSSSIHDLHLTNEPMQAFRRAQSLKAKGRYAVTLVTPQTALPSWPIIAGKKKTEPLNKSSTNLTMPPTGIENKPSKLKNLFRSGSAGLVARLDTQQQRDDAVHVGANLFLELEYKDKELKKRDKIICDMQRRERELKDRLSEQVQTQVQDSEKFEDILLGPSRATVVIQRYEELYSQARMEALDAMEAVQIKSSHYSRGEAAAVDASNTFNIQLLLDVFKTAYQCAWYHLRQLHCSWRELFGVVATTPAGTSEKSKSETSQSSDETNKWTAGEGEGEGEGEEGEEGEDMETEEEEELSSSGKPEKQLESAITVYLRKKCSQKDISPMTKMLWSQLDKQYFNHPLYAEVKDLPPFIDYTEECVRVAWALCIQTPPMTISCRETVYHSGLHKRFYNADKNQANILMHVWPVLMEINGDAIVRGTVLT